jgi:hypothetical protein
LGVIFMGLGITKVDQETIAQILRHMTVIALNNLSTGCLIGTDDFPILFGIELGGEFGRIDQVTEHHSELAAFSVGCARGHDRRDRLDRGCVLGRRR